MKLGPQNISRSGVLSAAALGYLKQSPLEHELLLGLWEGQPQTHSRAWWVLSEGERVLGVASFRPPISLIFSKMSNVAASLMGGALKAFAPAVRALHAPAELADALTQALELSATRRCRLVLVLSRAPSPFSGSGELSRARVQDRPWIERQIQVCLQEHTGAPARTMAMQYWLDCDDVFLWRNRAQVPVAMAIQNRRHAWGSCLGLVYTLPEHRRRGHAKAMISTLSADLLARGHAAVFLHASQNDDRATALYTGIGFSPVQALVSWDLA